MEFIFGISNDLTFRMILLYVLSSGLSYFSLRFILLRIGCLVVTVDIGLFWYDFVHHLASNLQMTCPTLTIPYHAYYG